MQRYSKIGNFTYASMYGVQYKKICVCTYMYIHMILGKTIVEQTVAGKIFMYVWSIHVCMYICMDIQYL